MKLSQSQLETLLSLGLTKNQSVLYAASLKYGILSALELSKLTKINRQQVYEDAEKLLDVGLYEITNRNRKKYIPAHPSKLTKIAEKKVEESKVTLSNIHSLLPSLEQLSERSKTNVFIKYYEGITKIKEAYESELEASKNTEIVSFVGSIEDVFEYFPESYWDRWNRRFAKYNSQSRMLVHKSEDARATAQKDKDYRRETRHLENFPLKINIDVFNNVVLIVSAQDKMAIWIESDTLSQSYRILFDTLWGLSKSFFK